MKQRKIFRVILSVIIFSISSLSIMGAEVVNGIIK